MSNTPALAAILLASGHATRFGSNKLLTDFGGRPLIDTVFDHLPAERFLQTIVVTRYAPVAISAAERRFSVVENPDKTGDVAKTIRLGLEAVSPSVSGALFLVCDQPLLRAQTIVALCEAFFSAPNHIWALAHAGARGNPVLFPRTLFGELSALPPKVGGAAVIRQHPALLQLLEVSDPRELSDIDTPDALRQTLASADPPA